MEKTDRIDNLIDKIMERIEKLDWDALSAEEILDYTKTLDVISGIYLRQETNSLLFKSMTNIGKSYMDTCCCETGLHSDMEAPAEAGEVNA